MGCDIHLYVEKQTESEWGWDHVHNPWPMPPWEHRPHPTARESYMLFAQLAGVRNFRGRNYDEKIIDKPWFEDRGVPDHIPRVYGWDEDPTDWATCADLHSHTWATLAELRAAPWDETSDAFGDTRKGTGFALWVFGPEMDALVAETGSPERVRVLMAFDN